jgi:hypothetical protein
MVVRDVEEEEVPASLSEEEEPEEEDAQENINYFLECNIIV